MLKFTDLIYRLKERARIRRQIPTRKSVQEGQHDRIADLLEESAMAISELTTPPENLTKLALKELEAFDCGEYKDRVAMMLGFLTKVNNTKTPVAWGRELNDSDELDVVSNKWKTERQDTQASKFYTIPLCGD